jgi:N-acetylneuraminate lyase
MTLLNGSVTALITPCDSSGVVDENALRELIRFQAGTGVVGLFVLGTAGQGPMQDVAERQHLAEVILAEAGDDLQVVVHVGAMPTTSALALAEHAASKGATAISTVPPVYYQPDFRSVRRYYEDVHEAAPGVPLLAYNNLPATGYDLRPDQAIELHRAGIIAGVKQASASVADLHALLRGGVPVWMANAGLNTAAFAMGCEGSISTITNVVPELFVALYDSFQAGDLVRARALQHHIDYAASRLRVPIIGALHAGVELRGLPGLQPRRPLRLPDADELVRIREAVAQLEEAGVGTAA